MGYDVVIVGTAPAGYFTAIELVKSGSKKKILIIENDNSASKPCSSQFCLNNRYECEHNCFLSEFFSGTGKCFGNKPSLLCEEYAVLSRHIGGQKAEEIFSCIKGYNFDFSLRNTADQHIYEQIKRYLLDSGVEIMCGVHFDDFIMENEKQCNGIICSGKAIYSCYSVIASGVSKNIFNAHGVEYPVKTGACFNTDINGLYYPDNYKCPVISSIAGVIIGREIYRYEFTQRIMMGDRAY